MIRVNYRDAKARKIARYTKGIKQFLKVARLCLTKGNETNQKKASEQSKFLMGVSHGYKYGDSKK